MVVSGDPTRAPLQCWPRRHDEWQLRQGRVGAWKTDLLSYTFVFCPSLAHSVNGQPSLVTLARTWPATCRFPVDSPDRKQEVQEAGEGKKQRASATAHSAKIADMFASVARRAEDFVSSAARGALNPGSIEVVSLNLDKARGLGLILSEGDGAPWGVLVDDFCELDDGTKGVAELSRRVCRGDAVVSVQGEEMRGAGYDAVTAAIRAARGSVLIGFAHPAFGERRVGGGGGGGGGGGSGSSAAAAAPSAPPMPSAGPPITTIDAALLRGVGLSQGEAADVLRRFGEHGIDASCLEDIDHELLQGIGVDKAGVRLKLMRLKKQAVAAAGGAAAAGGGRDGTRGGGGSSGNGGARQRRVRSKSPAAAAAEREPFIGSQPSSSSSSSGGRRVHSGSAAGCFRKLDALGGLWVRQEVEHFEALTGFETENRYSIFDPRAVQQGGGGNGGGNGGMGGMGGMLGVVAGGEAGAVGRPLFHAAEESGLVCRCLCGSSRAFKLHIVADDGTPFLRVERPYRFYFHALEVVSVADGRVVGRVERKFTFFSRDYALTGPDGEPLLVVSGAWYKPWTFDVSRSGGGGSVGQISKQWSGVLKESFTDADNFGVTWSPDLSGDEKALLLATVFLIDFMYFEDNNPVNANQVANGRGMAGGMDMASMARGFAFS